MTRPVVPLLSGIIFGALISKNFNLFYSQSVYLVPFFAIALLILCLKGEFPSLKIFLTLFVLGLLLGHRCCPSPPPANFPKGKTTISGNVIKVKANYTDTVTLGSLYLWQNSVKSKLEGKILVSLHGKARGRVKRGDKIKITVNLKPFKKNKIPATYSYVDSFKKQGILRRGSTSKLIYIKKSPCPYFKFIKYFRNKIQKFINTRYQVYSNFMESVLLGKRGKQGVSGENLKKTGTYHIVAISALHFGFVAWIFICFFQSLLRLIPNILFFPLSRIVKPKTIAYLFTIPCLFVFGDIVGWRSSTLRAFIMILTYLLCEILEVYSSLSERLIISAIILLIIFPKALFSVGFFMSYTTVLFIGITVEFSFVKKNYLSSGTQLKEEGIWRLFLERRPLKAADYIDLINVFSANLNLRIREVLSSTWRETVKLAVDSFAISTVVGIVWIPISAYFFNRVSLISPLSNFILLPIFSGFMFFTAISVVLHCINPSLAVFTIRIAEKINKVMFDTTGVLSGIPNASIWVPSIPLWVLVSFLFIFYLWLVIERYTEKPKVLTRVSICVLLIILSVKIFSFGKASINNREKIEFFRSRGMDLVLINSGNKNSLIFDGNPGFNDTFVVGNLAPSLLNRDTQHLDSIIIPYFKMKQLKHIKKINEIFNVNRAVFFGIFSSLEREMLKGTARELCFIPLHGDAKLFSDNLSCRITSKNITICYKSKEGENFLFYYGDFKKNAELWKEKDPVGVKISKVFWKRNLSAILKPAIKVIVFPKSYKRYGRIFQNINTINMYKEKWFSYQFGL